MNFCWHSLVPTPVSYFSEVQFKCPEATRLCGNTINTALKGNC